MAEKRKLVTVRQIAAIRPIPGADAIECATVEGWEVVVKKGEFTPGDRCVYFEIDAFLPLDDARYGFLTRNRRTWNGSEGVRLCTIKLRGQISQGLILPLAEFPEIIARLEADAGAGREQDFTELLRVQKWEPAVPAELQSEIAGPFPWYVPKTDQERIQNLPTVLTEEAEQTFEVTIKLDGASMTVFRRDDDTGVCSRNWWLLERAGNTPWKVARQQRLLEALVASGRNLALQGELIGEGIQGNPEKLRGQQFYLYDIWDIDRQSYLGHVERHNLLQTLRELGADLPTVPVLELTTLDRFKQSTAAVLAYAEGPSLHPLVSREGVVFKRLDGQRSFKAISNQYLLKHADR